MAHAASASRVRLLSLALLLAASALLIPAAGCPAVEVSVASTLPRVNGAHFTVTNWSPTHRNTVAPYVGCSTTDPY